MVEPNAAGIITACRGFESLLRHPTEQLCARGLASQSRFLDSRTRSARRLAPATNWMIRASSVVGVQPRVQRMQASAPNSSGVRRPWKLHAPGAEARRHLAQAKRVGTRRPRFPSSKAVVASAPVSDDAKPWRARSCTSNRPVPGERVVWARIGRMRFSKTGRTAYYEGREPGGEGRAWYRDDESGDRFWIQHAHADRPSPSRENILSENFLACPERSQTLQSHSDGQRTSS